MAGEISASQRAIALLHISGWTDSAIGRAVGRDSSLIHQIAVGKKPGRNLAGALETLQKSGIAGPKSAKQVPSIVPAGLPTAARRVTSGGALARVRQKYHGIPAQKLPNGSRYIEGHTKGAAKHAAGVARSMGETARIQIAIRTADGKTVVLGRKGGIRPETLDAYLKNARSFDEAIQAMLDDMYPVKVYGTRFSGYWLAARHNEAQFYVSSVNTPRE